MARINCLPLFRTSLTLIPTLLSVASELLRRCSIAGAGIFCSEQSADSFRHFLFFHIFTKKFIFLCKIKFVTNIVKRILLLTGKLAGYKGFAVLVATILLRAGYVGEAAWASVIISALCGAVLPKAVGNFGSSISDFYSENKGGKLYENTANHNQRTSRAVAKPSDSGKRAIENGKRKIREAVERAKSESENG